MRVMGGVLRLMRWPDHVLFTVPVTLLGANLALARSTGPVRPLPGLIALTANMLAVAFAFMVNDIADAPDDAADPQRARQNVVATGVLALRSAWIAALAVGALALLCFAALPLRAFVVGALTLLLGALYSLRPVRLKALPIVDVLAHVLLLAALLLLAGWLAYQPVRGAVVLPALAVALFSAYGQLYNQLRDEDADRRAGLRNSTALLGRRGAQRVMYGGLALGVLGLIVCVAQGAIPRGVVAGALVFAPLALLWRSRTDMRGSPALDWSGQLQAGALAGMTLVLLAWSASLLIGGR